MALRVRGFHGYLKAEQAKKMDDIAMSIEPRVEWEFEGSIGDFAEQWDEKFMVLRLGESKLPMIYITSYGSFGCYG